MAVCFCNSKSDGIDVGGVGVLVYNSIEGGGVMYLVPGHR